MKKSLKSKTRPCELNACLKHILRVCRWSGHFPVESLHNPRNMKFNLNSLYAVYYIFTWSYLLYNVGFCIFNEIFSKGYRAADITAVMVVLPVAIMTALMYRLAKHWPVLVQDAIDIERTIFGMVQIPSNTHKKCIILSYIVLALSLAEHIFFVNFSLQIEISCSKEKKLNIENFDRFLEHHFEIFFNIIPFYRILAIVAEFLMIQNIIMWNVTDILGMCFSIYLAAYFRQLSIVVHSDKPKDWKKIRGCYSRLAILLHLINEQLAAFVFLTSFTNLFFICKQLFNSLHEKVTELKIPGCDGNLNDPALGNAYLLYYVFSVLFLIVRSMGFVYMATNVHTMAKKAVMPLYEVPSTEYSEEVEYFQMQLRFTTIGISGIFFYIERRTILRVVATIVTYELVLLQFSFPRKSSNFDHDANFTIQLYRGTIF